MFRQKNYIYRNLYLITKSFKIKYGSAIINFLKITTICTYRFISVVFLFPVIQLQSSTYRLVCDKCLSKSFPQFHHVKTNYWL